MYSHKRRSPDPKARQRRKAMRAIAEQHDAERLHRALEITDQAVDIESEPQTTWTWATQPQRGASRDPAETARTPARKLRFRTDRPR